jgi:hypothetical protein
MEFLPKQFSVLNFLPHSIEMKIKSASSAVDILGILEKILNLADYAFSAMQRREYESFDSLIGENSCQIRAYMIYRFYKENIINTHSINSEHQSLKVLLANVKDTKNFIIAKKTDFLNNEFSEKTQVTLKSFLVDNALYLYFSTEIGLLIIMYILSKYTITNKEGIHTGINYLLMKENLEFSKTISRKIIHLYQVEVSKYSCLFIKKIACEISSIFPSYIKVIDELLFKDDDGRSVLPCYLTTDIILKHMSMNKELLVVNVCFEQKQEKIAFKVANNIFYNFDKSKNLNYFESHKPCMVFRGISSNMSSSQQIEKNLLMLEVTRALLGSTVRHPQYPGKLLAPLKEDPFSVIINTVTDEVIKNHLLKIRTEFLFLKKWALEHGCCDEAMHNFFFTHIFCGSTNNYTGISYDVNSVSSTI